MLFEHMKFFGQTFYASSISNDIRSKRLTWETKPVAYGFVFQYFNEKTMLLGVRNKQNEFLKAYLKGISVDQQENNGRNM